MLVPVYRWSLLFACVGRLRGLGRRRNSARHSRPHGATPARRASPTPDARHGGVRQRDRERRRARHPQGGRQRGRRGGGGGLRARGGAPRGGQHRRRRLHDHPPGGRQGLRARLPRDGARRRRRHDMYLDADGTADRPEHDRRTRRGRARLGGGHARGATAVSAGCRWPRWSTPAIRLARDGFVVDDSVPRSIAGDAARRLAQFSPAARRAVPRRRQGRRRPARTLKQPDLARTLEAIRDQGRDGFYRGWVAKAIVDEMETGGGIITEADLAGYQPRWREPIKISYRGYTIWSMPPVIVRGRDAGDDPEHHGRIRPAAAVRLDGAAAPRSRGDAPRIHGPQPLPGRSGLREAADAGEDAESKSYADAVRATIDLTHATPTPAVRRAIRTARTPRTTRWSTPRGNAVATTTTLNNHYGSRGDGERRRFPAQRRNGRLRHRAREAQHVRTGAGGDQRDRAREAHALGDDAEHRAGPARQARDGGRHPRRPHDHHAGLSRDQQRDRPRHVAGRRGGRPPTAPPGAAGRDPARIAADSMLR